jgi:hypothetical protein
MFVKTVYGEVENNAWQGIKATLNEVASLDEARASLEQTISLDHDYPEEWLKSDVISANEIIKTIECDGESFRVRSIGAKNSEPYSVYEYSIVSEAD